MPPPSGRPVAVVTPAGPTYTSAEPAAAGLTVMVVTEPLPSPPPAAITVAVVATVTAAVSIAISFELLRKRRPTCERDHRSSTPRRPSGRRTGRHPGRPR